jgi:uncharacterized protein YjbI with pentapeptide repeats
VRLKTEAFETLSAALTDGFSQRGDLERLAICIGRRLRDLADPNSRMPDLVRALIECAETGDSVEKLVACAQKHNPDNNLIAALDPASLESAAGTREAVERGGGGSEFKRRLMDALGEFEKPGMQALAGREMRTLLDGASGEEAETVLFALLGMVRTERPDDVLREMTPLVSAALRRCVGDGKRPDDLTIDFARARLRRIDLSELDLHEADLAFADLRNAELTNTNLWRSRAYGVNAAKAGLSRCNLEEARWHAAAAPEARFHDCRMVAAFFKEANLEGAQFQRSRLQGAHFERANLRAVRFEQANLADAYFVDAVVDEAAAASISRAENWQKARFDDATRTLIERAAES